jgi:hypothetical protein
MLMTFDSPDSTECTARRSESNTPLQALTLWNDPVFFECCQQLGRRIVAEAPLAKDAADATRARADYAFRLCFSRGAREEELEFVGQLHQRQTRLLQADEPAAAAIVGPAAPEQVSSAELASWVLIGRVLLNLDEFVTKQ